MQNKIHRFELYELDNISLTALRILLIFDMLLKSPCDDKDINDNLKSKIDESRSLSKDTICIYLNTLRLLGCVISRPTKNNDYKYALISHPFKLNITKKETETLIELRKYASSLCDWKSVIEIDNCFDFIYKYLNSSSKKLFSSTKKNLLKREITLENVFQDIKQLEKYCKQNKVITLLYNSPESGKKYITLTAEKINMENGAFYLWGYNEELESIMYLRLDRIVEVKSVSMQPKEINKKTLNVKYKLNGKTVESTISNKFKFFQEMLAHGSDCVILEPREIKEEMIYRLKNILSLYNNENSGVCNNEKKY